jgi:lipopolysaccharide export system permease protein
MKILRNYLLSEILNTFMVVLFVMTMVLVCGDVLTKMADLVINWGVDYRLLLKLFLYTTPFLFNFTMPMAFLIAVLLAFGKMSADNELTAMKASGVSLWKVIRPVLITALLLSLAALLMNDRIATTSHFRVRQISSEIGLKTPASILQEGVFIKEFKDLVIFIHRIRSIKLEGIRIYQSQPDGPTRTIIAKEGMLITNPEANEVTLKLFDGTTDEPDSNNPLKFYKLNFDTYSIPIDMSDRQFSRPKSKKPKEMTMRELNFEYQRLLRDHDFVANELTSEIHHKIAISMSIFILTLMGIPLAISARSTEKSKGLAIAIVLSTVYWTFLMGFRAMAKTGTIPPFICLHIPNILFGALAVFLLRKQLKS